MSRRLRPVPPRSGKAQTAAQPPLPARPAPADLHNPYGRYYTAARSFEQLVARHRTKK